MDIYDSLVIEAYSMAKFLFDDYKKSGIPIMMHDLLLGIGNCKVKANPGAEHSHHAVIDAVHLYYKKNEDREEMKEFYVAGLMDIAKNVADRSIIPKAMAIFSYELKIEKKGESAFTVDMKKVYKAFYKSLKKHIKRYEKEEPGYSNYLREHSKYTQDNYGYSYFD